MEFPPMNIFINFFITGFSLSDFLAVIGIIISVLTLWLGYVAYKKFLVNQLVSEQLQLVLQLIKFLSDNKINLTFTSIREDGGQGSSFWSKNLFEVAWFYKNDIRSRRLYKPDDRHQMLVPGEILHNPIFPNSISNSLWKINERFTVSEDRKSELQGDFVFIGAEHDELSFEDLLYSYEGGYEAFLHDCYIVKLAITKWLKQHGIDDLNDKIINPPVSIL